MVYDVDVFDKNTRKELIDMAQLNELKSIMVKNNINVESIANQLGISKQAVYKKMKGLIPFSSREISVISKMLELSNDQIVDIFLAL